MDDSLEQDRREKDDAPLGAPRVMCENCAEYLAGWKRAMADYQNREKELAREKQEVVAYTTGRVLLEHLPVLDNLREAMTHIPEAEREAGWVKGIGFIAKQFDDVLARHNVRPFASLGMPFDPNRHEAVGEGQGAPGTVVREVSIGYAIGERVLRPAKVIVGKEERQQAAIAET